MGAHEITVEELERDPYPVYARLRRDAPVCYVPCVGAWLVTSWHAVTYIAAHPELFGAANDSPLRRTLGENVLTVHGDAHRRLRSTMEPLLKQRAVDGYAPELVRRIAEPLFAAMADRGEAELMGEFLEPVAVLSLAHVLGLRDIDALTLRRWFAALAAGGSNYERDPAKDAVAAAVSAEIDEVVGPVIERLRRAGDDSLLSQMIHAEPAGGRLRRDELLANLKLILLGGMQEPGHAAGLIVWALLTHPEQALAVTHDPALVDPAVEEGLRWLAPVGTATRQVTAPVVLEGVELAVGDRVAAVLSSANRDEQRFPDGERFDIHRDTSKHRAFGIGAHFCVGHWLARHEVRLPVRMLFERLTHLRLSDTAPSVLWGWEFRGPQQLHVRWDRAR